MQITMSGVEVGSRYRERLAPSLWVLVAAAVVAPMAALVFVPLDTTVALIAGAVVAIAVVALLVAASPLVVVENGMLRAGRARIEVEHLGRAVALTGDEAAHARGRVWTDVPGTWSAGDRRDRGRRGAR
ncbi:DUF3093 family protein [Microbacterium hominis]|uniref:DUF3093 family protein n=1 Tax=Microbacterium hominis TaxID=162426 RepID=UPI00349F803B